VLDHTDLWLTPEVGARMVSYVPADGETRARLEELQAIALKRSGGDLPEDTP
jgi:hypothetical protein